MTKRAVLAVAVCATVVLAGCVGFGGGGDNGTTAADATDTTATDAATAGDQAPATDDTPTMADDAAATATATPTTGGATPATVAGPGGTNASQAGGFGFLEFEQPGTYTYEVTFAPTVREQRGTATAVTRQGQNRTTEYVIDVIEATDDRYEVQVSLTMGGMSNQQTFSGTRSEIQQQLLGSQVGSLLGPLTSMTGFYGGRTLQGGQSWSYSNEQGTASFEVTGTDSYAGVECSVTQATINGTVVHEACVSPDRGLAPYAGYYDTNGSFVFGMTLTDYRSG